MTTIPSVTEEELHAWLDGELPAEREAAVEAHLATRPDEWARLEGYRADGEAIARIFSCIETTLPAAPAAEVRQRPRWRWDARAAIAASVLIGVVGLAGGFFATREAPRSEYAELVDEVAGYHLVYARETTHLVELPADQRDELVSWLSERIGRKLAIPDLSGEGLTFAGGRMLVVNSRPVAQLLYTRAGGLPVGVCVTRLANALAPLTVEDRDGLRLASWVDGGYGYIVAGDLPETDVRQVAGRVAATFGG
jgi:anti-sigma factor RsiW